LVGAKYWKQAVALAVIISDSQRPDPPLPFGISAKTNSIFAYPMALTEAKGTDAA
jgi:hypothetical protein